MFEQLLWSEMDKCGMRARENSYTYTTTKRSTPKPYWDDTLQNSWDVLREQEKAWLKFKGPLSVRRTLKQKYCVQRKTFDRLHRKYKRKYQMQKRMELHNKLNSPDSRNFWREIGNIGVAEKRTQRIPWEVFDPSGNVITDIPRVLKCWKSDYSKLYHTEPDDTVVNTPDANLNSEYSEHSTQNSPLDTLITLEEVASSVARLKAGKSTGIDCIPAEVLKNETCIRMLHLLITKCFDMGIVPQKWRQGIINPIMKPGSTDPRKPLTYRGITLISVPCKVYCDILNRRLTNWLEDNDKISDAQNGFRKSRGCQEHVYTLYNIVNNRKHLKLSTLGCFTVDRSCLWLKLQQLGVKGKMYRALVSLYEDVKCQVRLNGILTEAFDVRRGLKQGCLLSPAAFSVYINDLILALNNS